MQKIFQPCPQIKTISLVVAMGLNREIGQEKVMPWSIKEDLQHFKHATLNRCVIMGRVTYESIGRPLPSRRNIVITSQDKSAFPPNVEVAHSLEQALTLARTQVAVDANLNAQECEVIEYDTICIIGGSRLFNQGLKIANVLDLTEIQATFPDADTFFPSFLDEHCKLLSTDPQQGFYTTQSEQPSQFKQCRVNQESNLQYRYMLYSLANQV